MIIEAGWRLTTPADMRTRGSERCLTPTHTGMLVIPIRIIFLIGKVVTISPTYLRQTDRGNLQRADRVNLRRQGKLGAPNW